MNRGRFPRVHDATEGPVAAVSRQGGGNGDHGGWGETLFRRTGMAASKWRRLATLFQRGKC